MESLLLRNIKLSREERALVLKVNTLLGDVLFTSDSVDKYEEWQDRQLLWRNKQQTTKVKTIKWLKPDSYQIETTTDDLRKSPVLNSQSSSRVFPILACDIPLNSAPPRWRGQSIPACLFFAIIEPLTMNKRA